MVLDKLAVAFTGLSSLSSYYFGIDYLIADGAAGKTGRVYCANGCRQTPPPVVPEPGEYAVAFMFTSTLAGLIVRARRRSKLSK